MMQGKDRSGKQERALAVIFYSYYCLLQLLFTTATIIIYSGKQERQAEAGAGGAMSQ